MLEEVKDEVETTPTSVELTEEEDILVLDEKEEIPPEEKPPETTEPATEVVSEDIPEWLDPVFKVKGKTTEESIKEQARGYSEARKEMARAVQETSEHRKLVDQYILSNLRQKKETMPTSTLPPSVLSQQLGLEDDVIRENMLRILQPVLEPLAKHVLDMRANISNTRADIDFYSKHKDKDEVVNSQEFKDWAYEIYPAEFLQIADSNPVLADKVLSAYKKFKGIKEEPQKTVTPVLQPPVIHTEKVQTPVKDKIWSRREIIELQQKDPQKYASLSDEILRAYQEKRIR